jgi:hypothetical protein
MAILGNTVLTLSDWAKRLDPDGKVPRIAELLSEQNEVLEDMLFMEGNLPTGHRTTVRTALPSVSWRKLNEGVAVSKSRSAQIDEQCGMLEAYSEVDKDLAMLNGNINAFRLSEAQAFIESMNQEMASTLFYGNDTVGGSTFAAEEFNGFASRYDTTDGGTGQNVISSQGVTGSNQSSSIYLVVWGQNTVHGIFPKGSTAGLQHEDLGLQVVNDATGIGAAKLRAYVDHWQWKVGLAVKDWRYVARICNIESDDIANSDLSEDMIRAMYRIPNLKAGKPVFYMNRSVFQQLDIDRRQDVLDGGQLNYADVDGKRIPMFRGIPIKICDSLLTTEATVTTE